ncbi:MAG: hypothetical protein OXN94_00380 [Chloroflexota bacterium]|nr:hypothetical protein [Chloroflexota bacterium]MDE2856281.1 hypothetical protein [Chloroflexota bacterium]
MSSAAVAGANASPTAQTKAELHRALLTLFIALITVLSGLLGGVIVHLHSITLNEIAELRTVMYQLLQVFSGG